MMSSFTELGLKGVGIIVGSWIAVWLLKALYQSQKLLAGVGNIPVERLLIAGTVLPRFLPAIKGFNRSFDFAWTSKYAHFKERGLDILAVIPMYPRLCVFLEIADPDAVKEVTSNRAVFPKPVRLYKKVFGLFGENVISTEGIEWKNHRKVVSKAFTEPNNKLVWQETIKITLELFEKWERDGMRDEVVIENVASVTRDLALMAISGAAFGMSLSWMDDGVVPTGHVLPFKRTLHVCMAGMVHRMAFADWFLNLYKFGRETRLAYQELRAYMIDMVDQRTTSTMTRDDLFSNLLKAREEEKGDSTVFSDSDLMGNLFVLLFAGHDTTANALAFALGLLAVYPEVQAKLLQQINQVVPSGQIPTYTDVPKLPYALAIIQETLRLYPVTVAIPKISAQDTSLPVTSAAGIKRRIPVPADTRIGISLPALHYNSKYWDDPEVFRPERFLTEYNKDAWAPFSLGARSCIGRRFSELESIAVLCLFVMRYKIRVTEDPKFSSETFDERKERVLRANMTSFLLRPTKVPLTFERR